MKKIGIFYGPQGGNCENIARRIKEKLGSAADLNAVADHDETSLEKYDILLFGLSTIGKETWDSSQQKKDWAYFFTRLHKVDLKSKKAAIFGLGDHLTYAAQFVDDIGILADKLIENGAELYGYTETNNYEFTDSKAIRNGKFAGLPLDENYEPEKSETRIEKWIDQLKKEIGF